MNRSIIRYVLGQILKIEAALMLLPIIVGFIYQERTAIIAYLFVSFAAFITGVLMTIRKPKDYVFYLKEGCVITALSWVILSLVGAVPFVLIGDIPSYLDAVFETISGFTTTGASILSDVECLTHASLMWRSFTHWIGGMGVLVFLLAIIPLTGGSNFNLMKAESPGPSVGKLAPKLRTSALILYEIYLVITALEIVILLIAGMPLFDAMATSFGTAGTGGFGIWNSSIGDYSVTIQWIVTIFMIAFGINFNAYFFIIAKQFKNAFAMEEVRAYLGIIVASTLVIAANIYSMCDGFFDALTKSSFQVASIITTTGFSTTDFNLWPSLSKTILVLLMFIGACAGSTGGGIKVSRFLILGKTFIKEANSYIHPRSVKKINMDGKPIDHDVVRATNVYLITFVTTFVVSLLIVSFENQDLVTTFTAVAATINNIGPGLELVGPTANFGFLTPLSKLVLMFDMLAGRLELFPMLILLHPGLWREAFSMQITKKRNRKKF